jgi:hypothetical protein
VSILGDPYNVPKFWVEAARILGPGGLMLFATPSIEWSTAFRKSLTETLQSKAEFVTRDGRHVWIESIVRPRAEQTRMIENAGLNVVSVESVTLSNLKNDNLSQN